MSRKTADDAAETRGPSDLAVADPPSSSGAHWAGRDVDMLDRRSTRRTPFRRPPAVNSFPDEDASLAPSAYLPPESGGPDGGWFGDRQRDDGGTPETRPAGGSSMGPGSPMGSRSPAGGGRPPAAGEAGQRPGAGGGTGQFAAIRPGAGQHEADEAAAGATPSRVSFGVTNEPISPAGRSAAMTSTGGFRTVDSGTGGFRAVDGSTGGFRAVEVGTGGMHAVDGGTGGSGAARGGTGGTRRDESFTAEFGTGDGIGVLVSGSHEIRAHRAGRQDSGGRAQNHSPTHGKPAAPGPRTGPGGQATEKPRRSRTVVVATVALGVLILLGGAASGMMFYSGSTKTKAADDKTVTAPLGGRSAATFELAAATTKVTVRMQDLAGELYKITSVDDTVPTAVVQDDQVQLHLTADGANAGGQVQILLSAKVRWALRLVGGGDQSVVDLGGGQISGMQVLGACRRLQLALPTPTGTVPISVTGAVEDLSITSPQNSPVRVQVASGAKTVAAGKRTLRDLQPGSTLTPTDWNTANRYDVDTASWVTLLSVDTK